MQLINSCDALKTIPLLMDEHIKTNKFARAYIKCFNQDKHKILYLKSDRLYHVEKVYVISGLGSFLVYEQKSATTWDVVVSKKFVSYARSVMRDKLYTIDFKKKFFIKRDDQRLINEKEVISYLRPKGFEIIQPERYSFIDELSLFYNAECIVGADGAGLANILYAPKECNVICIVSKESRCDAIANATVVQDVGTKVYYCPAKAIKNDRMALSFRVNITELEKVYDHIYSNSV